MAEIIDFFIIGEVLKYFLEAVLIVGIAMYLFAYFTAYDEIKEIWSGGQNGEGNIAIAIDYSAKLIAISRIVAAAILVCHGMVAVAVWGFFGIFMLLAAFKCLEHFMNNSGAAALQEGRIARGIFSAGLSLSIMFIVTAVIS